MGEAAQLITAIAALVTATGGAVAAIIVALGALRRQRRAAAEEAVHATTALPGQRGRHERVGDGDGEFWRDFAADMTESARGSTELARDMARDQRFNRLEHPDPPPGGPVPAPDGGDHV